MGNNKIVYDPFLEQFDNAIPEKVKLEVEYSVFIADRIWAILQKKGLTQREFARRLNKKESQVSKWLSGLHNFTLSTLAEIEAEFGVEIIEKKKKDLFAHSQPVSPRNSISWKPAQRKSESRLPASMLLWCD